MSTLQNGMDSVKKETENQAQQKTISFGSVDLQVASDGSCAVCQFSLLGVYEQNIVIPRPVILEFLKKWVDNERLIKDINRVVKSIPGSRND